MKHVLPLLLAFVSIFLLRITNLSIRLSDTNIYFYTAYELLQGKILYKDIFFTNLPLFPYLSSIYLLISNYNILFYYFTPTLEVISITLFIYYLVYTKTKNLRLSLMASFLYIFSFIVLSTSEHQTGVFQASLFSLFAYFFWQRKKYFWVGIFLGLTVLTKAYFIPVVFAFSFTLLLRKEIKNFIFEIIGIVCSILLILLPFLLISPHEIFNDIISYSLTRSPGISKTDILWFFIMKDFLFFVLIVFNTFTIRKYLFFGLLSIFSTLFFIFYSDPYYLYFNFLPPFLCLSFPNFVSYVEKKVRIQKMVFPTIIFIFLIYTFSTYISSFRNLGSFSNFDMLTTVIKKDRPKMLYGVNDTTPALAFLTNTQLLNNIVDTNPNIFRKKILNATVLTDAAVQSKSFIITHGAYYPAYNINEPVFDEIFDKKIILKHCKILATQPIYSEGIGNRINIFSCK